MIELLQNSYVILAISFVTLCIVFYIGEWGYEVKVVNGRPVKRFSWKYPLAISLIIWVVWHFYVYPPPDEYLDLSQVASAPTPVSPKLSVSPAYPNGMVQNINMTNWN